MEPYLPSLGQPLARLLQLANHNLILLPAPTLDGELHAYLSAMLVSDAQIGVGISDLHSTLVDGATLQQELLQFAEAMEASAQSFRLLAASLPPSRSLPFEPGRIGTTTDPFNGEVYEVDEGGQAAFLGVQPGWVMRSVDGHPYSMECLHEKINGTEPYTIVFEIR